MNGKIQQAVNGRCRYEFPELALWPNYGCCRRDTQDRVNHFAHGFGTLNLDIGA
jgi:hypothetical protein